MLTQDWQIAVARWPDFFGTEAERAKNCMLLGVLSNTGPGKAYDPEQGLFWEWKNSVALVAGKGRPIILSDWPVEGLEKLAPEVAKLSFEFEGFVGPEATAKKAMELYAAEKKILSKVKMNQNILMCTEVIPASPVLGQARVATADLLPILTQWSIAFGEEALNEKASESLKQEISNSIKARIERRYIWIWVNAKGAPLTMAGFAGETLEAIRLNSVYTPKPFRRRGYASALVAEMTTFALKEKRFVTLFTDKLNHTSNKIYQNIGYKFVADSAHVTAR